MRSDVPWVNDVVKCLALGVETICQGLQGADPSAHYRIGSSDRMVSDQIG